MKRILMATDFSSASDNAFEISKILALKTEAKLNIIHIEQYPYMDPSIPVNLTIENIETFNKISKSKLNVIKQKLVEAGINTSTTILNGDLVNSIEEYVSKHKNDYLIVGKGKTNDFIVKLFGHNAETFIKNIKIPIFTIPENWSLYEFKNLLVCVSLEIEDLDLIKKVIKLNKILKCEISLLHTKIPFQTDLDSDLQIKSEIEKLLKNEKYRFIESEESDLSESIKKIAIAKEAYLIVSSTEGKNFFEEIIAPSETKKLIRNLDLPLLSYLK